MSIADSIYLNGNIYTVDGKFSVAQAMAVRDGRLLWVGTNEQVEKYAAAGTKRHDLGGATVVPGLVESHLHFLSVGEVLLQINCFQKTKEQILAEVKAAYESLRPGEWILGRGWNELDWTVPGLPSKEELNAVAPDAPVCLVRVCGHTSWVNDAALRAGGVTRETTDPVGGEVFKDANGEPTGILTDTAAHMVRRLIPPMTKSRKRDAYAAAQAQFFSFGITAVCDMAANIGYDYGTIEHLKELFADGTLKIGVNAYVAADSAADAYQVGPECGLFGDLFSVRGIKFFTDGSLGARSAWMLDDYEDRPGHKGNGRYTNEELHAMVRACRANGFQAATHAIGDAAIRQVLDVYEKVFEELPEPKDHRYRIEHAQIVHGDDLKRFGELGVLPSMQFVHCTSDKNMTEDRIGAQRLPGAFAWRRMIGMGLPIPGGSDAPVELVNPFHGFYAGITRRDRAGEPKGGWRPEERVTREEALRAFTIWGAYASFEECVRGSLEVGKRADFAVLDRDIVTCPEDETKDTTVKATVQGGVCVYGKLG
ncbi:amidohydrolase [Synergistaceae bacterium OttesenSCG-928-I11]|nr:amidohydrolase [Synergistaceae bacterium OttesenSCG-928-I11]